MGALESFFIKLGGLGGLRRKRWAGHSDHENEQNKAGGNLGEGDVGQDNNQYQYFWSAHETWQEKRFLHS